VEYVLTVENIGIPAKRVRASSVSDVEGLGT